MSEFTVSLTPSPTATQVRLLRGRDVLLAAELPPPAAVRHNRAASVLLEALSLWLDARLRVVLSVDAKDASFCLDLTDELGHGVHSVYYEVDVVTGCSRSRADRPRRRTR